MPLGPTCLTYSDSTGKLTGEGEAKLKSIELVNWTGWHGRKSGFIGISRLPNVMLTFRLAVRFRLIELNAAKNSIGFFEDIYRLAGGRI